MTNPTPIDHRVMAAVRVLTVVESCSRFLDQVDSLPFEDKEEVAKLTHNLVRDVIIAAKGRGPRLAADVRTVAELLHIDLAHVDVAYERKARNN
jgi:hypothetical protein